MFEFKKINTMDGYVTLRPSKYPETREEAILAYKALEMYWDVEDESLIIIDNELKKFIDKTFQLLEL